MLLLSVGLTTPNITSQTRSILENYCSSSSSTSFDNSNQCGIAVTMTVHAGEVLKQIKLQQKEDIESLGNTAVVNALKISQGYTDTWRESIEHHAKNSALLQSHGINSNSFVDSSFENDLQIASSIVSAMGADKALKNLETKVLSLAKSYRTPEIMDYAVAVHTIIDLSTSPRGSLVNYQQQLQTAQTQWEATKMSLSLH